MRGEVVEGRVSSAVGSKDLLCPITLSRSVIFCWILGSGGLFSELVSVLDLGFVGGFLRTLVLLGRWPMAQGAMCMVTVGSGSKSHLWAVNHHKPASQSKYLGVSHFQA